MLDWVLRLYCGKASFSPPSVSTDETIGDAQLGRLREYAWRHFVYHAEQRMKCFNYFVLLIAAVTTGVCAIVSKADQALWVALLPLGIFLIVSSHLFEKLDMRNEQLVNLGREALKVLDLIEKHRLVQAKIEPLDVRSTLDRLSLMAVDDEDRLKSADRPSHHKAFAEAFRNCRWAGRALIFFTILGYLIFFIYKYLDDINFIIGCRS